MKAKTIVTVMLALATATTFAAGSKTGAKAKRVAVNEEGVPAAADQAVKINQYPQLGRRATFPAPGLPGGSNLGQCYKKDRKWIVLEAEYDTFAKCLEQLTFTWHVLLETKSATNKDKEGRSKLAPYSYFTTTVTYRNIPRGGHAASVCLHPSYLEVYGEPKAVGLVISDAEGSVITGDTVSELKPVPAHSKFWENPKVMEAKQANGDPYVERRQGLQDRSKTIWALVNPNDYELVQ